MRLDSLHKNPVISEQAPEAAEADPLDALKLGAPEGGGASPEGQEMPAPAPEEGSGEPEAEEGHTNNEVHRASETIDAVEKLQQAAAALEAARFVIQTEYSDFTLAKNIEQLKQQLVMAIGKAKEHVMQSGSKDPQAEKEVATWLNT